MTSLTPPPSPLWEDGCTLWRWAGGDGKTCKTVCPNLNARACKWQHSTIENLCWHLSDIDVYFASVFVSILTCYMSFPGEDVWRCSTDAAGEQTGPGRRSQQKSYSREGAETSRGEAHMNIQTTLWHDLLTMPLLRKKHLL